MPAQFCWHGCGRPARGYRPSARIPEHDIPSCCRRLCYLRAKARHTLAQILDAIGA